MFWLSNTKGLLPSNTHFLWEEFKCQCTHSEYRRSTWYCFPSWIVQPLLPCVGMLCYPVSISTYPLVADTRTFSCCSNRHIWISFHIRHVPVTRLILTIGREWKKPKKLSSERKRTDRWNDQTVIYSLVQGCNLWHNKNFLLLTSLSNGVYILY